VLSRKTTNTTLFFFTSHNLNFALKQDSLINFSGQFQIETNGIWAISIVLKFSQIVENIKFTNCFIYIFWNRIGGVMVIVLTSSVVVRIGYA
jgi:hypothetical protein